MEILQIILKIIAFFFTVGMGLGLNVVILMGISRLTGVDLEFNLILSIFVFIVAIIGVQGVFFYILGMLLSIPITFIIYVGYSIFLMVIGEIYAWFMDKIKNK